MADEPRNDALHNVPDAALAGGAYEVLRERLARSGQELRGRIEALNARRKEVFGGSDTALVGSARIATAHACVPRDMIHLGPKLILGYEVFLGLKQETEIADVFSVFDFDGKEFHARGSDFLADPAFERDFKELFKYYRAAKLLQLRNTGKHLLLAFQSGQGPLDLKVFRWALKPDGSVHYLDARGEREYVLPPQHDFEWTRATREMHVAGKHPHVAIHDEVFVECVGGDLTLKVENNTESGLGIYAEPVDDPDQSLDDAEIHFTLLENLILLKIRPYGESAYRHLVFNKLTRRAQRVDALGQACVQLPEGHGIVFPGGYYLQTGEWKQYDENVTGLQFQRVIRSPNGEDVLFVFYARNPGRYALLHYNLIEKKISTPIGCLGYSRYDDGKLVVATNGQHEPSRSHPVQIWQTPFYGEAYEPPHRSDSYLAKLGNRDLVLGISDLLTLARQAQGELESLTAFQALVRQAQGLLDRFHWLEHDECGALAGLVRAVRDAGNAALEEFEKVQAIRRNSAGQIEAFAAELDALLTEASSAGAEDMQAHTLALGRLRAARGRCISLRELRYADLPKLDALEARLLERHEALAARTVELLLRPNALAAQIARIEALHAQVAPLTKGVEAAPLKASLVELGGGLDLLAELVNTLKIEDPTQRTQIVEALSEAYALLNRSKAALAARLQDLAGRESAAEFAAQIKLLAQGLSNYLALCETPEKCDDLLARLLVQAEELEAKFAAAPEYAERIAAKRDEIAQAFAARKQSLLDKRQQRCAGLAAAVERVLLGVRRRASALEGADALNAYFASDPMVQKAREQIAALRELGDSVKADDLEAKLKSLRQEADRDLRDRLDLFADGAQLIRFGEHRFTVNTQPLDLSLLAREDGLYLHVTGTDLARRVDNPGLSEARAFWNQELPSENADVYRGAYLAWKLLDEAARGGNLEALRSAAAQGTLAERVRDAARERYDEGYERGVHDTDAAAILAALLEARERCGLLRFTPYARIPAALYWANLKDEQRRERFRRQAASLGQVRAQALGAEAGLLDRLERELEAFLKIANVPCADDDRRDAATYLFEELCAKSTGFVVSREAKELLDACLEAWLARGLKAQLLADLEALREAPGEALELARAWVSAFAAERSAGDSEEARIEAAGLLLTDGQLLRTQDAAPVEVQVTGLLGQHRAIAGGALTFRLDAFLKRLARFEAEERPAYLRYRAARQAFLDRERERMRLEDFKAKPLTTFVRNKLIDQVYLPLIGRNLAKQIGEAGENKRTDLMGLLLLISPPGYGKTTLMEYVAQRLGLIFMKVNGPALGHQVVSLDPAEAPDATSRAEVEKLNLAFEMGNNTMVYLDDIQHLSPELLQKFISLCDAQRKIEGVCNGRPRTYDLRGKKVVVVMAGNPYTESGARFRIPDMLANRADTYNLGDIIGGRQDLFELSYIENAVTSSPVLRPLAGRAPQDLHKLIELADGGEAKESDLGHAYSGAELREFVDTLRKLRTVQRTVLKVNQAYIASAAQSDDFRTEPSFKLQGSYRDMNKMAARVLPVLSEDELERVIADHYASESQTLTQGAEHNLLKLAELRGKQDDVQRARWEEIKRTFKRRQALFGLDQDDKTAHVISQLGSFNENLERIREAVAAAGAQRDEGALSAVLERMGAVLEGLAQARGESNEAMRASLEKFATGAEKEQAKIEIVNTLPRYYGNLYKHHIDVIEGVLIPLIQSLKLQSEEAQRSRALLDEVSKALRELLTRHETIALDRHTASRIEEEPVERDPAG
ncbi:MAG: DNA repair ATPase [Planctomycetes bacterium]|nr:DNA repair ATPase [Planctomycetota bacterium]